MKRNIIMILLLFVFPVCTFSMYFWDLWEDVEWLWEQLKWMNKDFMVDFDKNFHNNLLSGMSEWLWIDTDNIANEIIHKVNDELNWKLDEWFNSYDVNNLLKSWIDIKKKFIKNSTHRLFNKIDLAFKKFENKFDQKTKEEQKQLINNIFSKIDKKLKKKNLNKNTIKSLDYLKEKLKDKKFKLTKIDSWIVDNSIIPNLEMDLDIDIQAWYNNPDVDVDIDTQTWYDNSDVDVDNDVNTSTDNQINETLSDIDLVEIRYQMLQIINIEREKNWLSPVSLNDKLNLIAQKHAEYMAETNDFAHITKSWEKPYDRFVNWWYKFDNFWENLAVGQISVDQVMNDRMNSPWHRLNILDENFTEVWVWYKKYYWVQEFGKPSK